MMRTKLLFLFLAVSLAATGMVQAATIPVAGDAPKLEITSDKAGSINFRVEIGQLQTLDVSTKGGDFTQIFIPGFHTSKVEGQPELPMMNRLLSVPVGATPEIQVRNIQTRKISLADYGITAPIMPAQPSMSKSADPANVPFIYDVNAYRQSEVRNELVKMVYQGRMRAMDISRLEISPVAYYPGTGELEIVESMDVSISYVGADNKAASDLIASTYSPFFENLYDAVAGSKGFHDDYPDRVQSTVTMVVVTPPEFEAQLQDFVDWKTERGFNTILAVTGTPAVGTSTTSIQAYLHGLYNAATPENPAPSFVLFVGDVAQMPTFSTANGASDRPYCAVDGDLVPDMYYGRFSAENAAQLQAQLDKTLMYDQYLMPDPSYLDNVTLIAGVDGSWAPTHGNGQINYGTAHYFNAAHGITSNTYLYPLSDGPVEGEIIQTVNDGVSYINYTAHGSNTSWADPNMTQSDINGMTNSGKYTLAVGNCCVTSTYDYAECFGETFLRAPDKGAIGYIGGSNNTYWDEDYWWGVGYHPSGEIDGTAYPVGSTGIGAYDGVFHANGEPEDSYYVTNDALIFSGNLAVMESGSSRIEYYWNIYNLLGDPSLSCYMAPVANTLDHPATVFVGTPEMAVGADPGSYVGLTQNGVLMGAGTVDASGYVNITFLDVLTPGVPMKMVVTAQNRETYITDLNVIVPATVTIDPMVVDVNVPTAITVTVMGADGVTPKPDVEIWAEGLDYVTTPVMTDANGIAVINVTAAFGPMLYVAGQGVMDTYRLFTEEIVVNAADLASPDLAVTTDIGLADAFAMNLPGTMTATVAEAGHELFAVMPNGMIERTTDFSLVATPDRVGAVKGIIAVSGYNVYEESFDVIEAYGSIAGVVTSEGSPMAGVIVNCESDTGAPIFSVVTDATGAFASPEDVLVDDYVLVVDHFGYLHFDQAVFVNYGGNVFDIDLIPASSGILSGVVIDADTFEPLQGSVKVYRTDNNELYTEVTCDVDGTFATTALPYFDYEVRVRAWHHVPVSLVMTIDQAEVVKNFALTATTGDLLLIDDGAAAGAKAAKFGGKSGTELLAPSYVSNGAKSAVEMATDLETMGYFVKTEPAATVDPATFWDYDLVILACGDNTATLANTALKAALVDFAQAGGHILLEGGELGYDQYGDADFGTYVMHTTDWNHDASGDVTVLDSEAYILNNPNPSCGAMVCTYVGYGDSDAMAPLPDASFPTNWSTYPEDASVITYDPNPAPEGGQIVFFTFNYVSMDATRYNLLENAINWLTVLEVGTSSISGQAMLADQTDHSGITVTATPNGGSVTTGADGSFTFTGLYAGTYEIRASKANWSTEVETVTLLDGETVTDVNFVMLETTETTVCSQPGLATIDLQTVSDTMEVAIAGEITGVEVFVDITHTWRGDLVVTLISPSGTSVILANNTGSSADDIYGWYPGDLDPDGDLGLFTNEELAGTWTMTVEDTANADGGTFNEWCLHIIYETIVAVDDLPIAVNSVTGGMGLSWEVNPVGVEGYNVYRRTEDSSLARLNTQLMPVGDGRLSFVDAGVGLSNGQTVFYTYTLVRGGVESGYAQEVQAKFDSGLPKVFALRGNYPNPFNPMTKIAFDLPAASHVRLDIYDVSGRLVQTLVNEVRPAAQHVVTWDGTDRRGSRVASGIYYYRVQTDSRTATDKMMLIK